MYSEEMRLEVGQRDRTRRELISAHEYYAMNPCQLRPVGVNQYVTDGIGLGDHTLPEGLLRRHPLRRLVALRHQEADQNNYVAAITQLRNLPVAVDHHRHESSFGRTRLCGIADACIATCR